MIKNCIIKLQIYPFDIMVSIGERNDELKKNLSKYAMNPNEVNHYIEDWNKSFTVHGRTTMFECNETILRMRSNYKTPEWFAILQHEIFHCVELVFRKIGMPLGNKSAEAYAYCIEYLTREIYTRFKLLNK